MMAAVCVYIAHKAHKARDLALQYLIEAETENDNAEEAKETAKLLVKFIQEIRRCTSDDEYADTLLRWLPVLKKHGINVETDL